MKELPAALAPLSAYKQFILCKLVPSTKKPGKMEKLPIDWQSGQVVSAHDPRIWLDAATALNLAIQYGANYLPCFVFTKGDPFWFLDIDACRVADGSWSPLAQHLVSIFPGAAVEVSTSGHGLHIFGQGECPPHRVRPPTEIDQRFPGLEFYTDGRFVALTGKMLTQGIASTQFPMAHFVESWFKPAPKSAPAEWTDHPAPEWRGPTDDEDLIRRARSSKSGAQAFGNKVSFDDLWTANEMALAKAFPDNQRPYDASKADSALAQHLAFWTGRDCERIERLMRQSALVRPKWDQHETYLGKLTILGVVARQHQVLQDNPIKPDALSQRSAEQPRTTFKEVDVTSVASAAFQPQIWWWEAYIPAGHVTLLAGHGGAGKSTLALMLAVCIANGAPFLGCATLQGNVLFFSGEDPSPMLARRLNKVIRDLGLDPVSTAQRLRVIDATESDPALFRGERNDAEPTESYVELRRLIELYSADVVIVDNSSDAFDADEVRRTHVRKFMTALAHLVRPRGGAVLLLAHVDKLTSRADRGSGSENYSGSTAWHNSARSRLFLREVGDGTLVLEHQKSNDGHKAAPLTLAWPKDGLPEVLDSIVQQEVEADREAQHMRSILSALAEACQRGESISPAPNSPRSAAKVLHGRQGFPAELRPVAVNAILGKAEGRQFVEREQYTAAHRNVRERWKMTGHGTNFIASI